MSGYVHSGINPMIKVEPYKHENKVLVANKYGNAKVGNLKESDLTNVIQSVGNLNDLNTTDKTNIVTAINEIAQKEINMEIGNKKWFAVTDSNFSSNASDNCYFSVDNFDNVLWRNIALSIDLLNSPNIDEYFLNIVLWDGLNSIRIPLTNGKINYIWSTVNEGIRYYFYGLSDDNNPYDSMISPIKEYINWGSFYFPDFEGGYIGTCYIAPLAVNAITSDKIYVYVSEPVNDPFSAPD